MKYPRPWFITLCTFNGTIFSGIFQEMAPDEDGGYDLSQA
jgi:hypothetical protein